MSGSPFLTSLLGAAVEYFETLAIAYAILRAGYPREAISATVLGHVAMFALGAVIWPFHEALPVAWFRLLAAAMLTGMGSWWFAKSLRRLMLGRRPRWAADPLGTVGLVPAAAATAGGLFAWVAFAAMLKSSLVEAFEILLVVFPIGAATDAWGAVVAGAATGIAAVTLLAVLLHGQLRKVPEVHVKLVTGAVLAAIGIAWLVESFEWRVSGFGLRVS